MPRLTAGVVLRHPRTGSPVFLPAGTVCPDWAAGLLGEHVLDEPVSAEPVSAEPVEHEAGMPDLDELDPDDPSRAPDQVALPAPPPRFGQGSSRARWAEYAAACGVDVAADASRDDIVAACDTAGVPTG